MQPKENLKALLRELFQLDNTDLDFGIYRILNIKSKEVEQFINEELDKKIEEVKSKILERESVDLQAELVAAKKELTEKFQIDFTNAIEAEKKIEQYKQLALPLFNEPYKKLVTTQDKLNALRVSEDTEKSIYNELHRFFERYYEGGDFISKPRSGANNYMIPYNGEEVKLYWANYDQYYIKTGENFKNYIFNNGSTNVATAITVEFKILDADTAQNNNKEEKGRLFVPDENYFEWIAAERKLQIKFRYKVPSAEQKQQWGEKQSVKKEGKGINQRLIADLEKKIKSLKDNELFLLWQKTRSNSKGEAIPLFQYHLERYTTINKFDYFIHKDLKGFLSRELDYFLKNEVFSISFLDPDWKETEVQQSIKLNVLKTSAIRDLALTVIDFMSELENFQKRLFEKKKFVVQSDYCLTLDRIADKKLLHEILDFILKDKDEKQIEDWIQLGFIAEKKGIKKIKDILPSEESPLRHLVIDTAYLPETLKWKLLSSFENLDDVTNGLLINSENWQALNFLIEKYKGKVKCTYIDPPYNIGEEDFVYKDSFRHSSWLTMMESRIKIGKRLLNDESIHLVSIGREEEGTLRVLLDRIFNQTSIPFVWKSRAKPTNAGDAIYKPQIVAEFVFLNSLSNNVQFFPLTSEKLRTYPHDDKDGNYRTTSILTSNLGRYRRETMRFKIGKYKPPNEKRWKAGEDEILALYNSNRIGFNEEGEPFEKVYEQDETNQHLPFWTFLPEDLTGTAETGKAELSALMVEHEFDTVKPKELIMIFFAALTEKRDLILDYYAGTGTTAQAVIEMNREDGGDRGYVIVEMGKYFDSITKRRIQKVAFSDKWKKGKPEEDGKGVSQMFHYIKLEQYEDSLNNIEFRNGSPQISFLDKIRYQLDYSTRSSDSLMNIDKFFNPFTYSMKIVKLNEVDPAQKIDLVTTFNFFTGIEVQRIIVEQQQGREYRIVIGRKGQQQYIIVWRHFEEKKLDLTKERDWIRKQKWFSIDAILYCNGDNGFGANSTEAEFKRLMNEAVY